MRRGALHSHAACPVQSLCVPLHRLPTQDRQRLGIQLTARTEDVEFTGEMSEGRHVQPSGAVAQIYACPRCFSRLFTTNDRRPGLLNLRAGTLDTSKDLTPRFHVWVRSKQPWIVLPPGVPAFERNPATLEDWQKLLAPTPQT